MDASQYSPKRMYDIIDTNGQILQVTNIKSAIENIFEVENETLDEEHKQFIDIWGRSLYIKKTNTSAEQMR